MLKKTEEKSHGDLQKKIDELEECRKQKEEYLEGWKRERASSLNYKREEMERIEALIKYANEELILKMLPVIDHLYIAESQISEEMKKNDSVVGLLQIKNQLLDFLKKEGLEEIESLGKKFDPNLHEAVGETEGKGLDSGTITEEVQKGYKLRDKVIRPAKVKVSR
jgi:molecular chaperone GrpE